MLLHVNQRLRAIPLRRQTLLVERAHDRLAVLHEILFSQNTLRRNLFQRRNRVPLHHLVHIVRHSGRSRRLCHVPRLATCPLQIQRLKVPQFVVLLRNVVCPQPVHLHLVSQPARLGTHKRLPTNSQLHKSVRTLPNTVNRDILLVLQCLLL